MSGAEGLAEPGDPAGDPPGEAAWAELVRRWDDPAAHRELLASCADLDALAELGRRYRAVLEERPADPVAREMKDEILRRATAVGLAQLPRTRPPAPPSGVVPRRLLLGGVLVLATALSWMLGRLLLWTSP
jgi:hypothetical protein